MSYNSAANANPAGLQILASITAVQLFASNPSAQARTIRNDSTSAALAVNFGPPATGVSFTVCTVILLPGAYYELPQPLYTGIVLGIWQSATGFCNVTEIY